jgi:hypothetical protein
MVVVVSLSAIAVTGSFFAITSVLGGGAAVAALFLSLPVCAVSCLRVKRYSRTALFVTSLAAMAPLMVGMMLTWPAFSTGFPYVAGLTALFGGLAGMLTPEARTWHASESAHRLLDL